MWSAILAEYVVLSLEEGAIEEVTTGFEKSGRLGPARRKDRVLTEVAELTEDEAQRIAQSGQGLVAEVMPLSLVAPTRTVAPSEIEKDMTWGLEAIGCRGSDLDGSGSVVAVLDTGIDPDHAAFGHLEVETRSFVGNDATDNHGHGTHCAATIFGGDVDGVRIGVAPGVGRALVGKVLDDKGRGSTKSVISGLRWAAESGAHVVSCSIGFEFDAYFEKLKAGGLPERFAFAKALQEYERNVLIFDALARAARLGTDGTSPFHVFASGNASDRTAGENHVAGSCSPGRCFEMSIGALGKEGDGYRVAGFSNGPPDLVAPGVGILSAVPGGGLGLMDGTSNACPHVAGVAALWVQHLLREDGEIRPGAIASAVRRSRTRDRILDLGDFPRRLVGEGMVRVPN